MDLLFREYASPFILLDNLIISLKFNEWVDRFLESHKISIHALARSATAIYC